MDDVHRNCSSQPDKLLPLPVLIGISGASCGGKTMLASRLTEVWTAFGKRVKIIHQDDYFLPEDRLPRIDHLKYWNFDTPDAIDFTKLLIDLQNLRHEPTRSLRPDIIIIEGHTLFADSRLLELCQLRYFLLLPYEDCWRIRQQRVYDPPDVPGYFQEYVWPFYEKHSRELEERQRMSVSVGDNNDGHSLIQFLNGLAYEDNFRKVSAQIRAFFCANWLQITVDPLSLAEATDFVTDPSCGAISVFIGTTRDTFEGKQVVQLSYEAYTAMAMQRLNAMCIALRERFPSLKRIAVFHRTGIVLITEPSVIIAISSPHRRESLDAVSEAIDQLKAAVPIWKKIRLKFCMQPTHGPEA